MVKTLTIKNKRISIYGSRRDIDAAVVVLNDVAPVLTGDEPVDRLLLQRVIDDNDVKADILYDGNTVYSTKYVGKLKALKKKNSLNSLSNEMYSFLTSHWDYAHYDKNGFINDYLTFSNWLNTRNGIYELRVPSWYTDLQNILNQTGFAKIIDISYYQKKAKEIKGSL